MEMNNISRDKHEDNSDVTSMDHSNDKERSLAIESIFYHPPDGHHGLYDRATEADLHSDNRSNHLDVYSRNNFDIRSESGGAITESLPDINLYQNKKTVAQGMMDLALFSANANQLRYVLESNNHPYYYPGIILISTSLLFQVSIGVGLLWNTRYNVKSEKEICIANKINNFTIVGIFLVTVINVFISAFGVATSSTATSSLIVPLISRFGFNSTSNNTDLTFYGLDDEFNITTTANYTDY